MMHSEMMSELRAGVQVLSYAHVRRAFSTRACSIKHLPRISEVVVVPLHGRSHPGISFFVLATERRRCFGHDCTSLRLLVRSRIQHWKMAFSERDCTYRYETEHKKVRLEVERKYQLPLAS